MRSNRIPRIGVFLGTPVLFNFFTFWFLSLHHQAIHARYRIQFFQSAAVISILFPMPS